MEPADTPSALYEALDQEWRRLFETLLMAERLSRKDRARMAELERELKALAPTRADGPMTDPRRVNVCKPPSERKLLSPLPKSDKPCS